MSKRKLNEARRTYLCDPKESNVIRYAVQLINSGDNEEALVILEKVVSDEKKAIANLYKAIAYRNLKNEDKFFFYIKSINNVELMSEVYYEIANFYYLKMVNIKKEFKSGKKTSDSFLEAEKLLSDVRINLDKSLEIGKTGINLFLYGNVEFYECNYEKAKGYYLEIIDNLNLKLKLKDLFFVKYRLAEIYLKQNEFDQALKYTTDLINTQNYNNSIYILHARILWKKGNLKEAQKYYKKAIEKFHDISDKDCFDYAKLCADLLDEEEAVKYFRECKGTYFEPRAIQEEAKMNISLGNYSRAIVLYKMLLNGSEKDKNIARIGIGVVLRKQSKYEEAKKWLVEALNGNEKDICLANIELSKIAEEEENFVEAEKYLNECIKMSQGKFGKLELAKIKIKNDELKYAKEILDEILKISDNNFDKQEAILSLASIERICCNYEKAINYVSPFLAFESPIYYRAICLLIDCYLDKSDLAEAEKFIERLDFSKNKVDRDRALFYKGELARLKGDEKTAEMYYLKLNNNSYNNEQILFNIASMNLRKNEKRFFEIIDELKCYSSQGFYMSNYLLGIYWIESQEFDKAKEYLVKNIETKNSFTIISLIVLAKHEEINGKYDNALKYYKQVALEKQKYYLRALFKLGEINLKFGNYDESRKYFNEILNKESKYYNLAKINLAVIDSHLGNYELAEDILLSFVGTKEESYAKFELAKSKIREGKYNESLEILKLLENSNNRKYVLLETARIKNILGLHEESLKCLDVLYNESEGYDQRLALVEIARTYYVMKNYKKAKRIYLKLLNEQNVFKSSARGINVDENIDYMGNLSFRDELLIELSRVERMFGDIESAINYLFMVNNDREKIFAISELVDIEIERNNYQKALEYAELIKNSFIKDSIKLKKTTIYLNTGNYEAVHNICDELKCEEFNNIKTYRNAMAYFCEEDFGNAKILFEELIKLDTEFKSLSLMYLGRIAVLENDYEKAKVYFSGENLENNSKLRQLLLIDIHEKKYEEALAKAIELFNRTKNFKEKESMSFILSFVSYKLNVLLPKKYYGEHSIYKDSIFHYNKEQMYTYIYRQATGKNEFNKSVDVLLLLDMLEQGLNEKYFIRNNLYDEYAIPIKNIGKDNKDFLKILTIPNSNNIISIYPSSTKHELFDEYIRKKTRN